MYWKSGKIAEENIKGTEWNRNFSILNSRTPSQNETSKTSCRRLFENFLPRLDLSVNFHHEHFIDPTNNPWVSEDGLYQALFSFRLARRNVIFKAKRK